MNCKWLAICTLLVLLSCSALALCNDENNNPVEEPEERERDENNNERLESRIMAANTGLRGVGNLGKSGVVIPASLGLILLLGTIGLLVARKVMTNSLVSGSPQGRQVL